jgi:NADH-quinone oxidoreductase subunit C/D
VVDKLNITEELKSRFGGEKIAEQETKDDVPTVWVDKADVGGVLRYLKNRINEPYKMLYDLTAIDERPRKNRAMAIDNDFTLVYQLFSFGRNQYLRVKVPLKGEYPSIGTITDLWPCANWYEREVWDMFGIKIDEHPHLERILMPNWWQGHPLRKEHPARATEMQDFTFDDKALIEQQQMLEFKPEDWGMKRHSQDSDFMFLNLGPHHPGTHGVLRIVLQLNDEEIIDAVPDIGYHHRGAEKMGERQSWHTYIPYTDRVDYLGGVMNNLAYLMAVEKLAGIEIPPRAQVIRVMMAELFRIASHLVWYGTFAQDLGAMSPVFYMFSDRERIFDIVQTITGGRMHPGWFRIGGVSQDLPIGWDGMVRSFLDYMPARMREYDKLVMDNEILKARTKGVGAYTVDEAIEWGVTWPGLRACGLEWDFRKKTPYSGYENFDFEIPTGQNGDCYDRAVVRVEEIRQSLRIIRQCVDNMPAGPYKSDHPLTTPPLKEHTMQDIETLIAHFLTVSWGPVMPAGEAFFGIEATKGNNGYYVISDGNTVSYRTRIRTPSFPHIQILSKISKGGMVADLIAILGSIDFVLADVDR